MYYIDRIQAQGKRQRKIPLPRKFWLEFSLNSMVKIESLSNQNLFYVDKIQAQGKQQRRIPVPQKFWSEFPVGTFVKIELLKKDER